uniref:Uncharacterized protein n=1 Tax=Romanomermis culicivorax TaxID=13658 RepID=A0A915JXW0_ROMCU
MLLRQYQLPKFVKISLLFAVI